MAETVYLALRCSDGIDLQHFAVNFGQPFVATYPEAISRCAPHLVTVGGRAHLDVEGWLVYNHLIENFL
jgi:oxygen-independent coproporphyrinogen-3 oxidase